MAYFNMDFNPRMINPGTSAGLRSTWLSSGGETRTQLVDLVGKSAHAVDGGCT